jgi:hypothetical protein
MNQRFFPARPSTQRIEGQQQIKRLMPNSFSAPRALGLAALLTLTACDRGGAQGKIHVAAKQPFVDDPKWK